MALQRLTARPELYGIDGAGNGKQRSPPDGSVQLGKRGRVRQRMSKLPESGCEYDDAVGQQHESGEEPDRHCCAHWLLLYQKAMFSRRKMTKTTDAHKAGFWYQ